MITNDVFRDPRALCAIAVDRYGPRVAELWFPLDESTGSEKARAICGACPAREGCLSWALTRDVEGVWGGTTTEERAFMRAWLAVRPADAVSA